ncbi:hypothetical protein SAMN05444157_3538 [Frankineae bacterium MT45]|nr:hypothetical protein SAMN05444157_3538 [Frankineae bacterium MT45]
MARHVDVVTWAQAPAKHDYPAAGNYLRLICSADQVAAITQLLIEAPTVHQYAKDILRASQLPLLPADDPEVAKDLKRIRKGVALAPVLLVRGDLASGRPLQVADGYHRVCASYLVSEDTDIPCRLADLPTPAN